MSIKFLFQKWVTSLKEKRRERKFEQYRSLSTEEIFSTVYKKNIWGGQTGTFYSGEGTSDPNVVRYEEVVVKFVSDNNISSITEIGCGDFRIMEKVLKQLPGIAYTGADVVPELIEHNKSKFTNLNARFVTLNAIEEPLPKAELLIIRQVLQHLSNNDIQKILSKVSGFKYALITEHVSITPNAIVNIDKLTGPHIRTRFNSGVFIDQPPFSIPNSEIVLEYRFDEKVKNKVIPATIRSYLVRNI